MAVSFSAAGTDVATVTTTLALVAPSCNIGDILIAQVISQNNTSLGLPSGSWTTIRDIANTSAMQSAIAWKRVVSGDSGGTFNFTVAGTTLSYGILTVYSGVAGVGVVSSTSANASADNVTYATITPSTNQGAVVSCGYYNLGATTAGSVTGTNPTFSNVVDVETASGLTASLFQSWGVCDGIATGARTQPSNSTVDAINHGFLFDLQASGEGGAGGSQNTLYPPTQRVQQVRRTR